VRAGTPRHLALAAGRDLLVREVSPTGAPRPNCCCAPLGALLKGKQIGPGRQSEPLRLGTVTADCPPGAALFAAQRAARARWACGLALHSPSYREPESSFSSPAAAGSVHASTCSGGKVVAGRLEGRGMIADSLGRVSQGRGAGERRLGSVAGPMWPLSRGRCCSAKKLATSVDISEVASTAVCYFPDRNLCDLHTSRQVSRVGPRVLGER
jgi:hypothetical protein